MASAPPVTPMFRTLQPRHWARGAGALVLGLGIALAIPALARQRGLGLPDPGPAPLPGAGATFRTVAPGAVLTLPGSPVLYAGPAAAGASATLDEAAAPAPASAPTPADITAPVLPRIWHARELPAGVPRKLYFGWAQVTVTEEGVVTAARMAESTGEPAVDEATVRRLLRERLEPARRTLAEGTKVPVPYEGRLYVSWITVGE